MSNHDYFIEETTKPYQVSVASLTEPGALRKFGVFQPDVEEAIFRILNVLDSFTPDVVVLASSILSLFVAREFQLRIPSMLQTAEQYLNSGETKAGSQALLMTLRLDFQKIVNRYETVRLSKAVNVSEVLSTPQEVLDERAKQIRVGYGD